MLLTRFLFSTVTSVEISDVALRRRCENVMMGKRKCRHEVKGDALSFSFLP